MNNPEQLQLRAMSTDDRADWFSKFAHRIWCVNLYTIRVDGHCVATGREDELSDMLVRLNEYVDGPDRPVREGGMG